MMVAPMQTAYGNYPQPTQHFQPQSPPVYASQVIHPTMMVQDPMVRILSVIIFIVHMEECCLPCWFLIANGISIL